MDFKNLIKRYWPYGAGALTVLLVVLIIVLSTCSGPSGNTEPSGESNSGVTTVPTTSAPDETTQPTTAPTQTTAPSMLYANPLTGEPMEEPSTQRPIAVMLNNIKAAMPQHGVSQADILYEVLAEGGITRCMGIFSDISDVEKLGSIRSARKYYIDIALGYGAAYVHAGGSDEALNYLKTLKNIDLDGSLSGTHFYRDQNRLNAGYASEHTLFTSGEKVLDFAAKQNVTTTADKEKSYGMTFDDGKVIVGEAAKKVTVYFNQGGKPGSYTKSTALTYDEETKTYFAQQHGGDYIDGNTKETISFRNIVVVRAGTSLQSNGKLLTVNTTGSGTGYFACNGQLVPINWSRQSVNEPFTFTLENGNPITFGVGSTYIAVVPTNATVSYE